MIAKRFDSLEGNVWKDEETKETEPYNLFKQTEHFDIFEELNNMQYD